MTQTMRTHRERGFTLLEAIVAVAVLGIALIPLLSFISQSALQLRLAGEANTRSLAEQNVLALMETLNPMEQPEGQADLGNLRVTWTSRVTVPIQRVGGGYGLPGYTLGFYNVDVRVLREKDVAWFDLVVRKIGYRSNMQDMP